MKLIGMLDSPFVRRVAISFHLQKIPFEHLPLSVFSSLEEFSAINPVIKAPTLVTDDGTMFMESSLILEYGERIAAPALKLLPSDLSTFVRAQRIISLSLAACEKTVQIVYEHNLRPAEKMHQPWLDRVQGQLLAAYALLERDVQDANPWIFDERPLQADITSAVAFRFSREMLPEIVTPAAFPTLSKLSAHAESTKAFKALPFA